MCVAGRRACPPEDVGGVWGYADFLEATADPEHEEHDEMLEWAGDEFDPAAFDIDAINARLRATIGSAQAAFKELEVSMVIYRTPVYWCVVEVVESCRVVSDSLG